MPHLLNINNYHYRRGGSDVVYFEHAALMEQLGWKNAYFSMLHPKNVMSPWARFFIDEIEFGRDYSLLEKSRMAAKVVYSVEARRKLRQLLDYFPADVAHLHCIYHHLSPAIIPLLAESGIPIVMTAHDLKLACPAYKMLNRGGICERCKGGKVLNVIRHRCIHGSLAASVVVGVESMLHGMLDTYRKHLDRVVVPSRFFRDKFVEWGWPAEKFVYIPNYVAAHEFHPVFDPGSYFLYFGRLSEEKGVATLIRAAAAARVSLKVAGIGPEDARLRALAAACNADVDFVGFQSGAPLHALVSHARAVVLPSEWYENAPMSILESCALGKPVIGANIGGIPEMIEQGETGWLFESGKVEALAQLLRDVASLPGARLAAIGRAARRLVEERFNRDGYAQAMLSLYASLTKRTAARVAPAACR